MGSPISVSRISDSNRPRLISWLLTGIRVEWRTIDPPPRTISPGGSLAEPPFKVDNPTGAYSPVSRPLCDRASRVRSHAFAERRGGVDSRERHEHSGTSYSADPPSPTGRRRSG